MSNRHEHDDIDITAFPFEKQREILLSGFDGDEREAVRRTIFAKTYTVPHEVPASVDRGQEEGDHRSGDRYGHQGEVHDRQGVQGLQGRQDPFLLRGALRGITCSFCGALRCGVDRGGGEGDHEQPHRREGQLPPPLAE